MAIKIDKTGAYSADPKDLREILRIINSLAGRKKVKNLFFLQGDPVKRSKIGTVINLKIEFI